MDESLQAAPGFPGLSPSQIHNPYGEVKKGHHKGEDLKDRDNDEKIGQVAAIDTGQKQLFHKKAMALKKRYPTQPLNMGRRTKTAKATP